MGDEVEMDGKEGRLLAGRYRLAGVLGRGGMGTVWRARDEVLGRTVAVKELRFPGGVEEDEKRRLITRTLREAKAIARIRNNGAVTVYDVVDEDDRPWIVMELVEGRSLAELVRDDGPLTTRRAAEVGLAVLDVLRAAHREGILHRDVKPSNVLMSDDGRVVLTDFGIAQVEGDPSVTSTGMLVGAPSYISPERARGQKPGPPADLWSLGGLLYACVEGVPPYDKGSAIATLTAVMTEPVEPPKHAGALADVILGLLVKDPDGRLDDAGARVLLEKVAHGPEESEPPLDATRAMTLPVVPEEAPPRPAAKPKAAPKPARPRPKRPKAAPKPAASPAPAPVAPKPAAGSGTAKGGAPAKAAGDRPGFDSEAAKERMRDALKTVRAAAAAAASTASTAASKAAAARNGAGSGSGSGAGGGRPPRASVTDVVPRRTLIIIAVVVALAVVAAILGFALSGGDSGDSADAGKDIEATAAQTHASGGGGTPDGGKATPSGDAPSAPGGKGDGKGEDDGKDALPDGYANVTNGDFHFRVAMPEGWHRTGTAGQNSGAIFGKDADGFPRIQIDYNASPGKDAAASWRQLEPAVRGSTPDYHRIAIKPVRWRDYPTVADWSFTRSSHGQKVRVLNRGFRADDDHGYAIMITCKADAWSDAECKKLRDTAFATFAVKD